MTESRNYSRTPADQLPTQPYVQPEKQAALAPTMHAGGEMPRPGEKAGQPEEQVEQTRKSIGCGAIAVLCLGMAASGAVGTMSYLYISKKPPFDTVDVAGAASTASNSNVMTDTPPEDATNSAVTIRSNQDLHEALLKHELTVTARDFGFETERPEFQAKALYLTSASAADDHYNWRPVRERITRTGQPELLVAVRILNPNLGDNYFNLLVPEGLSYRAKAADPKDPSIIYFYYHCSDKNGQSNMLAQLGIRDPQKPRKLLWGKSFLVSDCPE
jgi:hypothetical protein